MSNNYGLFEGTNKRTSCNRASTKFVLGGATKGDDRAEAEMSEGDKPMQLTKITLRPRIVVSPGVKEERVLKFTEMAHKQCYIANSLSTEVAVEPTVEIREKESAD